MRKHQKLWDVSAKIQAVGRCSAGWWGDKLLWKETLFNSFISLKRAIHFCCTAEGRSSSHSDPCRHNSCKSIFAGLRKADLNPVGSKICATWLRMLLFVSLVEFKPSMASFLNESSVMFQTAPSTLFSTEPVRTLTFPPCWSRLLLRSLFDCHSLTLKPPFSSTLLIPVVSSWACCTVWMESSISSM